MNDEYLEYLEDMGAEVKDALDRMSGNRAEYFEYLKKFTEDSSIADLRKAVADKDADAATAAVHTLKGVALSLGLMPVADACADMLLNFRSGKVSDAFSDMVSINAVLDKWGEIIKNPAA